MKRSRKLYIHIAALAVLVTAVTLVPRVAHAQADLLDGKVFVVAEGDLGKPAKLENVLTFSDGKFHSKACDEWGYDKGEVKAFREGDAIRFEAETRSEKYGTRQVWNGTVKGTAIEGTRTLYPKASFFRPNPAPSEGWFKGTSRSN
jgi:hypothetical protein